MKGDHEILEILTVFMGEIGDGTNWHRDYPTTGNYYLMLKTRGISKMKALRAFRKLRREWKVK